MNKFDNFYFLVYEDKVNSMDFIYFNNGERERVISDGVL